MWGFLKRQTKEKTETAERRRMHRIRILLSVSCQVNKFSEPFLMVTHDINTLGIRFVSSNKLIKGQNVKLNILLQSNYPSVFAIGRVEWCREYMKNGKPVYEGGIEFTLITDENRLFLDSFIKRFSIASYEPSLFLN